MQDIRAGLDFLACILEEDDLSARSWNLACAATKTLKKAKNKLKKFEHKQQDRDLTGYSRSHNLQHGDDREAETSLRAVENKARTTSPE